MDAPQASDSPRPARRAGVRGALLSVARVALPAAYAVGFGACALWLSTHVAAVVMAALVLGSACWLAACLRMADERRASHLALHGFVAKVLMLPVEAVSLMVYVGAALSAHVSFPALTWVLSAAGMYLGVLGASAFVVFGAREAHRRGTLSLGWARALAVCACVPALGVVPAVFLWFSALRERLEEAERPGR